MIYLKTENLIFFQLLLQLQKEESKSFKDYDIIIKLIIKKYKKYNLNFYFLL